MEIFRKIKEKIQNFIQRNNTKRLGEGKSNNFEDYRKIEYLTKPYVSQIKNTDRYVRLNSIKFDNQIRHSDGRITNVMIAKVINGINGKTYYEDKQDYIAFEIPHEAQIDNIILQKILRQYLLEKNMGNNEQCMYIGKINNNPLDFYVNKSDAVKQYVKEQISPYIRNEVNNQNLRQEQSFIDIHNNTKDSCKQYREDFKKNTNQKLEYEKQRKKERIENFYLRKKSEYIGKNQRTYQEYDGINVFNGDFLRLRQLDKIGKDIETQSTYLYTAYIQTTGHSSDVELLSKGEEPIGMIPVCFTSNKKVDEIMKQNNQKEIYNLLALFSDKENYENNNGYLNYIGSIDYNGNIFKNQDNLPKSIQYNIKKLQQQLYERKMNKKIQEGQMQGK